MKKTNENGVTLTSLIIVVVLLVILSSVGITSGISTINYMKYREFVTELEVVQTKVNELNQNNQTNIGKSLTTTDLTSEEVEKYRSILNVEEVGNIIYKNKTVAEIAEIKEGFRYCSKNYIQSDLELDEIRRDFLINVDRRIAISCEPFKYNDINYYIISQIEGEEYNVEYNEKNAQSGTFEVNYIEENERWKIEISNINYDGYIQNWTVKYKLVGDTSWSTSNSLIFYVDEPGEYTFRVAHGDEAYLGTKTETVMNTIDNKKTEVNETVLAVSTTDTKLLKDTYGNIVKVPAGFGIPNDSASTVPGGIVIEDVSAGSITTNGITTNPTQGSQFVWVPVGTVYTSENKGTSVDIELGRYNTFSTTATPVQSQNTGTYIAPTNSSSGQINTYYYEFADNDETNDVLGSTFENTKAKDLADFISSAVSNGGYYIARYEAGISGSIESDTNETYNNLSKNSSNNFQIVTKAGIGVWNCINQLNAATVCQNMYATSSTNSNIKSDLVNSYAWDTALIYITKCSNSSYASQSRLQTSLTTTGNASNGTRNDVECNIYDMAGNVHEWSTETSTYSDSPCVRRGGNYDSTDTSNERGNESDTGISDHCRIPCTFIFVTNFGKGMSGYTFGKAVEN